MELFHFQLSSVSEQRALEHCVGIGTLRQVGDNVLNSQTRGDVFAGKS